MNNHIVYAGYAENVCMYVGEGKPDRYKHLNSGTSHVYEANRHHFAGKVLDIRILESGLAKAEAERLEVVYIDQLNPCWNKRAFLEANSDSIRQTVKSKIFKVFGVSSKEDSKAKSKQREVCRYLGGILNNDGKVLVQRGQVESAIGGLPSGFMSRCASVETLYYKHISKIFSVVMVDSKYYEVRLK